MANLIPTLIPVADPVPSTPLPATADQSLFSTFDVAIGGLGFRLASDVEKPMVWETAPYTRQQIDQAAEAGEQTLTTWWMKSQSSFHGGAGNLNLERVDLPAEYTHIRFDKSKNVDVWTPGQVRRLPDTTRVSTDTASQIVSLSVSGADRAVYVNQSHAAVLLDPATPSTTPLSGVTESAYSVATDGERVFVAGATGVWRVDPATPGSAVKIATYPASSTSPVVGWVKSRLMLGVNGAVYEVDSTSATTVALGSTQLRYQHPNSGWTWRCFAETPSSLVAAGDAGVYSEIVEFTVDTSGATPVLTVADTMASTPPGERILSLRNTMGTFLGIGTNAGFRVGQFGTAYATPPLQLGPLTLPMTETQFPVAAVAATSRFFYAAGLAVDEPGLIRVDLGTQTDQAGRFAWATDLIAPVQEAASPVTAVCALPSGLLVFSVPGYGLCYQSSTSPGHVREAWLQTSRIRYGTTEPKLFKLGRVRGDLADGTVRVESISRSSSEVSGTVGNTTKEPDEFALPDGRLEWLALKFTLTGSAVVLNSYGLKALPGTKRQKMIQVVVSCADNETDRRGHRYVDIGSARGRAQALFDLDALGDEVLFEEFGIYGTTRTLVVIEKVQFIETGRPTNTSDFGGQLMVTMRTVS